jgi:hypothetical protein
MGYKFPHGKLSVVYDQAGKARIVAMTNNVYQLALQRIHDMIFSILKTIPSDGTFDQLKPLKNLVNLDSKEAFYCFDLSAATDRLPIDVQIQVLNLLIPGLGTRWGRLLDID